MRTAPLVLLALAAPTVAGCYETIYIDPPPRDAGAPYRPPSGNCVEPSGVDLLFVIDNSNSMAEEQESLAAELPGFVSALLEPPDENGDGEPDWLPVRDLQIGVITADMGTGGYDVPTCSGAFGDDGILRTEGRGELLECDAVYPRFFRHTAGSVPSEELALHVGCVAQAGVGGCGFEQPLEATLKALSPAAPTRYTGPSYTPPRFFRDTSGHADGANAGFVRDDTLLAVIIVTDEEDCSASDPALFDPASPRYGTADLNLRCFTHPDALHPIERYVTGLTALRPDRPDLFVLGILAGIPADLAVPAPTGTEYWRMLTDSRMVERVDPRATVQSICQSDYRPVAAAFASLIGRRACTRYDD